MGPVLKRYTKLPYLLHLLSTKKLRLINSSSWDDKNDCYNIEQYQMKKGLRSVYLLCLTSANETYHHWKVYSGDSAGVRIDFDKEMFEKWALEQGLKAGTVKYLTLDEIEKTPLELESLPFIKRYGFKDEMEYRILQDNTASTNSFIDLNFDLAIIRTIATNPWLPADVHNAIKGVLQNVLGERETIIKRSNLTNSNNWKKFIDKV